MLKGTFGNFIASISLKELKGDDSFHTSAILN